MECLFGEWQHFGAASPTETCDDISGLVHPTFRAASGVALSARWNRDDVWALENVIMVEEVVMPLPVERQRI
jgi:hypothetical protein